MKFARRIKRSIEKQINGRTTCPKCHAKLVYKDGYGKVCAECGWWKETNQNENGGVE